MAVRTFDAPETTAGHSDYLDQPGLYHLLVEVVRDGKNSKNEVFKGFTLEVQVLSGEHTGKKTNLSVSYPEATHKDGGDFCKRREAAFYIATNLMTPAHLAQKGLAIDPETAAGAQIVAELAFGKDRDGKQSKFLDFKGTNIYHVDDPRAADCAKDAETLGLIDDDKRHKPEFFEPLTKKAAPKAAKPAVTDSFDDL